MKKSTKTQMQSTNCTLSKVSDCPVLDNDDILIRQDIVDLLRRSGVGGKVGYYERINNNKKIPFPH